MDKKEIGFWMRALIVLLAASLLTLLFSLIVIFSQLPK